MAECALSKPALSRKKARPEQQQELELEDATWFCRVGHEVDGVRQQGVKQALGDTENRAERWRTRSSQPACSRRIRWPQAQIL